MQANTLAFYKSKKQEYWANQIFWGFVTWGFKLGDKLGGLII